MPSLRLPILVSLLGVAHGYDDETSMMQRLNMKDIKSKKERSVGSLLEAAGTLLKNGATQDVVEFTRATMDEIVGTVIPAIADASEADQRLLDQIYAMFEAALVELEAGTEDIFNLNLENRQHSTQHKECRDLEAMRCEEKRTCDYDLWDLWKVFVDEERELRSIQVEIDGHFCADKNGTLETFRAQSVVHFEEFFIQKPRVEVAEEGYDNKHPFCENHFEVLDDKTAECDAHQLTLEQSACQLADKVQRVQNQFDCAWTTALDLYEQTVIEVRILQQDRIQEYTTLSVVECLLNRTTERNGRPCEESTDEITTEITHCELHRTTVDTTWLELIYHIVGPCPAVCPDRDSVQGRCYPEMPPYPCQAAYINGEYASLPDVPIPPFSEVNSHCNLRPDCQECHLPELAVCSHDLACVPGTPPVTTESPPTLPPVTHSPGPESCGSPPEHPFASVPALDVPYGGYVTYTCHDGYSVNGAGLLDQTVQCCAMAHVFGTIIPCLPTVCGSPPSISNADIAPSFVPHQIVHGSSAPYICLNGHEVSDGSTSFDVQCINGLFDMHAGCQPISCGAPPQMQYALSAAVTDTISFPHSVEYDCLPGYSLDGNSMPPMSFEITCQSDGTFTSGECRQDSCGPAPTLINSEWTEETQTLLNAGNPLTLTVLQHKCLEGHAFAGVQHDSATRNVECRPNGMYSAVLSCMPINDCIGHSCGAFGICVDQHKNYTCDCLDGYDIQDTINAEGIPELICGNIDDCQGHQCGEGGTCEDQVGDYTCNCREGFMLTEYANVKNCERVECGVPPSIDNAQTTHNRDNGGKTIFEDITAYSCLEGHSLTGTHDGARDFEITCLANGNFSSIPVCQPISCGQPMPVLNTVVSSDVVMFPNSARYDCEEGYTVTGFASGATSFQKYCTDSGQLLTLSLGQAVLISCQPVFCGTPPTFDLATYTGAGGFFGQIVEYTCVEGHSTDPQDPAAISFASECLADGTWTDFPGYCAPVSCPIDNSLEALNHFAGPPTVAGQVVEHAVFTMPVVYTCKEGYSVDGSPSGLRQQMGTCSMDGVFSVSPCRPVVCESSNLEFGPHATLSTEHRDYIFGESALVQCGPGWEVCESMSPSLMTRVQSQTEFEVACLGTGDFSPPIMCTNIDDCVGHTCGPFGTCVDGQEDYSCSCLPGYEETESQGERICGNIDDCNGNFCGAGGTCNDLIGSFECHCSFGYEHEVAGNVESVCIPTTCSLPVFENTDVTSGVTLTFGDRFQVKCNFGFTASNNLGEDFGVACSGEGLVVGLDGTEASVPQCVPKTCPLPPVIPFAVTFPEQRDYVYGETVTYGCANGDAEVVLACGSWSWGLAGDWNSFYTCGNSCGQPQTPANGRRDGEGEVNHPMSAQLSCDVGFTHLSSGEYSAMSHFTQHCRASGEFQAWDAEFNVVAGRVICIPVQCSRPSPPLNWRWASDGLFDTVTPATLVCEDGYSSNGMPHASTQQPFSCNVDGTVNSLPAPCVAITHRIVGEVTDAVTGYLLAGATVTIHDSSGFEHELVTGADGRYVIENLVRGEVTILVVKDSYTEWTATIDLQHDIEHGMVDAALNPHLQDNSWRVVLTWLQHPRDLDSHVTRHQSPGGPTMDDAGSARSHLYWRQTHIRSLNYWSDWVTGSVFPSARLDRDNVYGNGIPETVTFFDLDACVHDCHFVYRVWDYCSLDNALTEESGALVRLYNSAGLHSTYNINQQGSQHRGTGVVQGWDTLERRWDVFQLDASDQNGVVVSECLEGLCPENNIDPSLAHAWC